MQQVLAQLVLDLPQQADHGLAGTAPLLVHIHHCAGEEQRQRQSHNIELQFTSGPEGAAGL